MSETLCKFRGIKDEFWAEVITFAPVSFEIIISITGFVNILSQFLFSFVESISHLARVSARNTGFKLLLYNS